MKKVLAIVLCLMLSLSFTLTAFAAEEDPDAEALAKRAANIEVVTRFYDEVFNAHDISKLDEFMRDDRCILQMYLRSQRHGQQGC